mgnify:CR=1 FL=1
MITFICLTKNKMKKQLIILLMCSVLIGCVSTLKSGEISKESESKSLPIENYIKTDIEREKNDAYVSIFYSVTGITNEGGEELTVLLTKDNNNKDKIVKLTQVHRINTAIEQIELTDNKKISQILAELQKLKAEDDEDQKTIEMIINLLKKIK